MMDIDYGKLMGARPLRIQNQTSRYGKKPISMSNQQQAAKVASGQNSKLALIISLAIIFFTIGLLSGIFYQKNRSLLNTHTGSNVAQQNQLANVGNSNQNKTPDDSTEQGMALGESEAGQDSLLDTLKQVDEGNAKVDAQTKTAAKTNEKKSLTNVLNSDEDSYHILAKRYDTEKEAMFYGKKLKSLNLGAKVFLAKNRDKMKVYIGPIKGKKNAYNIMKTVKAMNEFKGAILYKN